MKKSIYKKQFQETGIGGTHTAEITVTMNDHTEKRNVTNASTHETETRSVNMHVVELRVDNTPYKSEKFTDENKVLMQAEIFVQEAQAEVNNRAHTPRVKPFSEKIAEIFK